MSLPSVTARGPPRDASPAAGAARRRVMRARASRPRLAPRVAASALSLSRRRAPPPRRLCLSLFVSAIHLGALTRRRRQGLRARTLAIRAHRSPLSPRVSRSRAQLPPRSLFSVQPPPALAASCARGASRLSRLAPVSRGRIARRRLSPGVGRALSLAALAESVCRRGAGRGARRREVRPPSLTRGRQAPTPSRRRAGIAAPRFAALFWSSDVAAECEIAPPASEARPYDAFSGIARRRRAAANWPTLSSGCSTPRRPRRHAADSRRAQRPLSTTCSLLAVRSAPATSSSRERRDAPRTAPRRPALRQARACRRARGVPTAPPRRRSGCARASPLSPTPQGGVRCRAAPAPPSGGRRPRRRDVVGAAAQLRPRRGRGRKLRVRRERFGAPPALRHGGPPCARRRPRARPSARRAQGRTLLAPRPPQRAIPPRAGVRARAPGGRAPRARSATPTDGVRKRLERRSNERAVSATPRARRRRRRRARARRRAACRRRRAAAPCTARGRALTAARSMALVAWRRATAPRRRASSDRASERALRRRSAGRGRALTPLRAPRRPRARAPPRAPLQRLGAGGARRLRRGRCDARRSWSADATRARPSPRGAAARRKIATALRSAARHASVGASRRAARGRGRRPGRAPQHGGYDGDRLREARSRRATALASTRAPRPRAHRVGRPRVARSAARCAPLRSRGALCSRGRAGARGVCDAPSAHRAPRAMRGRDAPSVERERAPRSRDAFPSRRNRQRGVRPGRRAAPCAPLARRRGPSARRAPSSRGDGARRARLATCGGVSAPPLRFQARREPSAFAVAPMLDRHRASAAHPRVAVLARGPPPSLSRRLSALSLRSTSEPLTASRPRGAAHTRLSHTVGASGPPARPRRRLRVARAAPERFAACTPAPRGAVAQARRRQRRELRDGRPAASAQRAPSRTARGSPPQRVAAVALTRRPPSRQLGRRAARHREHEVRRAIASRAREEVDASSPRRVRRASRDARGVRSRLSTRAEARSRCRVASRERPAPPPAAASRERATAGQQRALPPPRGRRARGSRLPRRRSRSRRPR